MATVDEILATMSDDDAVTAAEELIIIDPNTRQLSIPGIELTFGVESDAGSERKYFLCPRYVGNGLDLAACFIRVNFRNANGEIDTYLVDDVTVSGENVAFSWLLSQKVTRYKGQTKFVVCAVGPDLKVEWHTTLGTGIVLEGLEPDSSIVEPGTADVVAQLIAMVERQTAVIENAGATQVQAVRSASETAMAAAVAEIEAKRANSLASIPSDYTALSDAVDTIAKSGAPGIVCSTEGTTIIVSDASDQALRGLRLFGRSTQDGTPSYDAPVEIVSVESPLVTVCGRNLLDADALASKTEYHGLKAEYEGSGIFHIYGTVSSTQTSAHLTTDVSIPIDPNKEHTFCAELVEGTITGSTRLHPYLGIGDAPGKSTNWLAVKIDSASTVGSVVTNTSRPIDHNADAKFVTRFWVYVAFPAVGDVVDIRIRVWLTQTNVPVAYTPYTGQTVKTLHSVRGVTVDFGGNYTDETGQQWICDEVDLDRRVYVQRIYEQTILANRITTIDSNYLEFGAYCSVIADLPMMVNNDLKLMSSDFAIGVPTNKRNNPEFVENYRVYQSNGGGLVVRYPASAGAKTLAEAKSDFNGRKVRYVLATPIETPLSETEIAAYRALHSNNPYTTVLNDGGAYMSVKYTADTKLYIDNKIKEALK